MRKPEEQTTLSLQKLATNFNRTSGPHLYRQIASLVRDQVRSGALRPGDALPPQRELSVAWGIGEVTVRRALQQLGSEGLLEARPGIGTVIVDPASAELAFGRHPGLTIGVAFANLTDGYPFFTPVLAGMRSDNCDVAIRLFDMPEHEQSAGSLAHAPPLAELDGLILMSPINLALLAQSQRVRLPTVLLFGDLADGFSNCILPDYASGVVETVAHLVQTGRQRIALVTANAERFSTGRWIEAYRAAIKAHRLPLHADWIIQAGYSERDGAQATRELLALTPRPDAILFASDFMARGALLAAHEAALSIPGELAIIGAGPTLDDGGWTVPLSTIDLGLYDMGRLARQCIDAARDGRSQGPSRHAVNSRLRHGSTG